jgi:hypothetical protein
MKLEDFQKNVLNTLKDRPMSSEKHPYFTELKGSYPYRLTQDTVVYWRSSQISRNCVLTTRYLNAKGLLKESILQLYREESLSNFAEEVSFFFLDKMSVANNSVLSSIAGFERANLGVRFRRKVPMVVHWQYEPVRVLHALMKNEYSDECLTPGEFVTEVYTETGKGFEIYSLEEWQAHKKNNFISNQ